MKGTKRNVNPRPSNQALPSPLEEQEQERHETQHQAAAHPGPVHDEHEARPERREPQGVDKAAEHLRGRQYTRGQ